MNARPLRWMAMPLAMAVVTGCAETPSLSFAGDDASPLGRADGSSALDAGQPAETGSDSGGRDAPAVLPTDDGDDPDAGASGAHTCGGTTVANCANCAGAPILCVVGTRDECVSDCAACAPGALPCVHCNASGKPRARCVGVKPSGVLKCASANKCTCSGAPSTCPGASSAAQVCDRTSACSTCGEQGTAGMACAGPDGAGACGDAGSCN